MITPLPPDSEQRLVIEALDPSGRVIERYVGYSQEQLRLQHEHGECGFLCGYCYEDGCAFLDKSQPEKTSPGFFSKSADIT